MMSLKKDVEKLCDDALQSGRSAFTYAMYLRVNLAYKEGEGWCVIGVVMDGPMTEALGDDVGTSVSLSMLCVLIADRLENDLKFDVPTKLPTPPHMPVSWLVRSKGGPKPATVTQIDIDACERIVRYARRDGRGTVTMAGWKFSLYREKVGDSWTLNVARVDSLETRDDISAAHYGLGHIHATIGRLLRVPVRLEKEPMVAGDGEDLTPRG